jgi:uncharacterized iron-regulated membrane protein
MIFPAQKPDQAFRVTVATGSSTQAIAINPYTGEALGPAPGPPALQKFLLQVHLALLWGKSGRAVVSFVTLCSFLLVIVGLILWWRDKSWRIRWSASWKRIVYDLHHVLGVVAALVLLLITMTGVWMGYPKVVDPLVLALNASGTPSSTPGMMMQPDPSATRISYDSIAKLAHSVVPGAPITMMMDGLVVLRYPEDRSPSGRSRVSIDVYRGKVLQAANTRTMEAGSKLMSLQRPLHTGDIFGTAGRLVWCLAAIILASQSVTGCVMWWGGRRGRRRAARSP